MTNMIEEQNLSLENDMIQIQQLIVGILTICNRHKELDYIVDTVSLIEDKLMIMQMEKEK